MWDEQAARRRLAQFAEFQRQGVPVPDFQEWAMRDLACAYGALDRARSDVWAPPLFSERKRIDDEFREWATENNAEYCVMNFLAFQNTVTKRKPDQPSRLGRILFAISKPFRPCTQGGWRHDWRPFQFASCWKCERCDACMTNIAGCWYETKWRPMRGKPVPPQGGSGTAKPPQPAEPARSLARFTAEQLEALRSGKSVDEVLKHHEPHGTPNPHLPQGGLGE